MKVGVHVSIAKSISLSIKRAKKLGCNTFQIFTRNPRRWDYKELLPEEIDLFKQELANSGIKPVMAHMPYLPNLASPKDTLWDRSMQRLKIELQRCNKLGIDYLITHLGSPKSKGKEFGINRVTLALSNVLEKYQGKTTLLLENSAGKQDKLGARLEDFEEVFSKTSFENKLGFCFDTCHAFASGYDFRTREKAEKIIKLIDKKISLKKCYVVHCNDSKYPLGEGRDRHEHIGLGLIGDIGFSNLFRSEKLRKLPLICETPVDERRGDSENVLHLKKLLTGIINPASF
ncbi:MAG: deoxyribonuclease IV [Candidatus Heimdallarchaeota archaeon]|nr:deoxyribonuclease IV [Candidatus Heimdallarchaeota archaeon]